MNFYFLYSFFPSYLFLPSCFWSVLKVVDLRSIPWVVEHEERTRQIQEKWTLVQDPEPGDEFREACAFGLFHFGEVGVYGIIAGGRVYFMEVNIWAGGHLWDFFFTCHASKSVSHLEESLSMSLGEKWKTKR